MSLLSMIESNPLTAYPVLIFLVLILLYLARKQMHNMINSSTRIVSHALRLASKSFLLAEAKLKQRNREVLLATGAVEIEKDLDPSINLRRRKLVPVAFFPMANGTGVPVIFETPCSEDSFQLR